MVAEYNVKTKRNWILGAAVTALLLVYLVDTYRIIEHFMSGTRFTLVFLLSIQIMIYAGTGYALRSRCEGIFLRWFPCYVLVYTLDSVGFKFVHYTLINAVQGLDRKLVELSPAGLSIFVAIYLIYFVFFLATFYAGYRWAAKKYKLNRPGFTGGPVS